MKYGSITHNEDSIDNNNNNQSLLSPWAIASILSTAFAYGCTMTTFFLLVLPLECRRIESQIFQFSSSLSSSSSNSNDYYLPLLQILGNKSISLGIFAAIAGLAQLISPLIGLLSDCYNPPKRYHNLYLLGKRLPYLFLGSILTLLGISWEFISSSTAAAATITEIYFVDSLQQQRIPILSLSRVLWPWFHYFIAFLLHNLGLNIIYTVMMCFIPDLVPTSQIGQANGIFALLLVLGSLFGFAIFQTVVSDGSFFSNNNNNEIPSSSSSSLPSSENTNGGVIGMYKVYFGVSIGAAALTYHFVMQRLEEMRKEQQQQQQINSSSSSPWVTSHHLDIITHHYHHAISVPPIQRNNDNNSMMILNTELPSTMDKPQSSSNSNTLTYNWPPIHLFFYFLLYKPISTKSMADIRSAYWIESTGIYHDFFIVTISRLFYYMGISSQTFFLYFVHDVVVMNNSNTTTMNSNHPLISSVFNHPEVTVAILAIIGQMSGALTCYPVGLLSDKYFEGRRKPFVYVSCLLLALGYLTLLLSQTLHQIMSICILLGAANGMYLTMDTSLAVDTLPSSSIPILDHSSSDHSLHNLSLLLHGNDDDKTKIRIISTEHAIEDSKSLQQQQEQKCKNSSSHHHGAAQLLGVWGVFGFIGSSIGPLIGGMVLFFLGKPNDDGNLQDSSYYSKRGYTILFSLSACCFFCAAISLTFIQKKGV